MKNKKVERASWEHNIETYIKPVRFFEDKIDWTVFGATTFLVTFGLIALAVIYG